MRRRSFRSILLACTAITVALPAAPLMAQDTVTSTSAGETQLDTIVVKGKRVQETIVSDSPLASEQSADDLRQNEVTSFRDLGRVLEPGVDFSDAVRGVTIRGLGGPRVVTTIDGIPLPYLDNFARRGGPSSTTNANGGGDSFDFSSISSLDVLRGGDSSRLGSGALAGGIALRTLEPDDLITGDKDWGGVTKFTYDSEDNSFSGSAAVAKRVENTSVLFQGTYKKGDERQTNGDVDAIGPTRTEADPADYDQSNILLKLRQDLAGGHQIGITGERYRRDKDTDLKTLQGATTGSSRVWAIGENNGFDDTDRDRISIDYSFVNPAENEVIQSARLSIYWQDTTKNAGATGRRVGTFAGPWLRDNQLEETSYGLTGNIVSEFSTGMLDHELTIGIDGALSSTSQYVAGIDACSLGITTSPACSNLKANLSDMPDVDGQRFGIYIDDKITFENSAFALTPGIRFDWYRYEPQLTDAYAITNAYAVGGLPPESDGSRFSPKLLGTYDLTDEVQLFAQWSMAYRAPTVNELYLSFVNTGYAVVGNPNLEAETSNSFEVGANFDFDSFTGRVSAYHSRYKNFIDQTTTFGDPTYGRLTRYNNLERVHISGFEFSLRKDFDNGLFVHTGGAYSYGEDKDTGDYLRSVLPFKGVVGVGYEQVNWGADLSLIMAAGMRDDGNVATFDAPGYGLVDLTAWWEPEQFEGLRIQAGIYNLLDKTYFDAVELEDFNPTTVPGAGNTNQPIDYYSEPGRTFKISLTQKF